MEQGTFVNVYEEVETGRRVFGCLHMSRQSAHEGARDHVEDWRGKRRWLYLLHITKQRAALQLGHPGQPLRPAR